MERIDSPTDVALTQCKGEPEDTTQEIILKIAGTLFPPIGLVTALRDHFSSNKRHERIHQVLLALKSDIELLIRECAQNEARAHAIEERLQSPTFTEAVLTAAEEAARTAHTEKLNRLASTLANGLDPDIIQAEDDLPSFVRDVSQLSELDIKTLGIIITAAPMVYWESYNPRTTDIHLGQHLIEAAAREKLGSDDFYSTAYRLVGFGLALEVPSQTGRRSSNDLRFIPTRRGRKLSTLLKQRS